MNYKKLLSVIIILIILAVASLLIYQYRSSVLHVSQTAKQTLTVEDKKIVDNTKPFKIDIAYPQINGLPAFNKLVEDAVNKEISNFKKNSLDNDAAVKQIDPIDYAKYPREYDLNIGYDKGEIDENIVSVMLNVYNFEGGAHGASYFVPINFNVKNQQTIKLADLFPNQSDYLTKISAYCITDLTKQIITKLGNTNGTYIQDGAGPAEENFQYFLINKDNLVFYFPQYQVAYGAAGDFKVVMPR